jgi:hypothetical protein
MQEVKMKRNWGNLIVASLIAWGAAGCAHDHDHREHAYHRHDRDRDDVYRRPARVEVIEPGRPIGRPEFSGHPEYGNYPDNVPAPDLRR